MEVEVYLVMQHTKHEAGTAVVGPRIDVQAEMQQILCAQQL
jgi:hypothetical protein